LLNRQLAQLLEAIQLPDEATAAEDGIGPE
jgi:hypothetical protein